MRLRVVLALLAFSGSAYAQPGNTAPRAPQDPYGPQPPPGTPKPPPTAPAPAPAPIGPTPVGPAPAPGPIAPPGQTPAVPTPSPADPVLDEQVAQSLVHRAQELYDARVYVDAKQLAVEALVKSPKGAAAEHAKYLIKKINAQLGIDDTQTPPATDQVDLSGFSDRAPPPSELPPTPEQPRASRLSTSVHSGLYVGLLGTTVGSFFRDESPASGAVPAGLATAAAGAVFVPQLVDKLKWNEAQIRTMGSGSVWGGVVGGLFGDIGRKNNTSSRQVLVGASIGATAGGAMGALLARKDDYTPGDVALVDTLAGVGAVGGLTVGMLMQPAESEAYSLNSVFGVAGGVVVGLIAAPQTNTTPRRMARVAGITAIGGAAPFLLYAGIYDNDSKGDERAVGALSSIGMLAGLYIGFRVTSGMDEGKDKLPRKPEDDDAPPTLLGRSSSGNWQLGTPGVQPLSRELAPQPGMALSLVGGTF